MKKPEYLMVTAINDCAKLEEALSTCLRCGTDERTIKPNRKNGKVAIDCLLSLQATMAMLTGSGVLDLPTDTAIDTVTTQKIQQIDDEMSRYLNKNNVQVHSKIIQYPSHLAD